MEKRDDNKILTEFAALRHGCEDIQAIRLNGDYRNRPLLGTQADGNQGPFIKGVIWNSGFYGAFNLSDFRPWAIANKAVAFITRPPANLRHEHAVNRLYLFPIPMLKEYRAVNGYIEITQMSWNEVEGTA